jgi:hypothetical protein
MPWSSEFNAWSCPNHPQAGIHHSDE